MLNVGVRAKAGVRQASGLRFYWPCCATQSVSGPYPWRNIFSLFSYVFVPALNQHLRSKDGRLPGNRANTGERNYTIDVLLYQAHVPIHDRCVLNQHSSPTSPSETATSRHLTQRTLRRVCHGSGRIPTFSFSCTTTRQRRELNVRNLAR